MLLILVLLVSIAVISVKAYLKLTQGINKSSKHLVGKVVIVTGGNAGIGFETSKDLADRGARVIIACRNEGRGNKARDQIIAATGNQDVHYRSLDLASLTSVRKFADDFNNTENRLDILINNAGVAEGDNVKTEDGLQLGMQINHFGPFLLTNLLLPKLKASAPSRIINVSSIAYRAGVVDFQNLNLEKETDETFSFMKLYSNTKLCNVYMTVELERQLKGTGVTVNCLHPGAVDTNILNGLEKPWVKYLYKPVFRFVSKTSWEGAQTSIYLAVSPEVNDVSGRYFSDCSEQKLTKVARDPEIARKLWEVSERLVKLQ